MYGAIVQDFNKHGAFGVVLVMLENRVIPQIHREYHGVGSLACDEISRTT